MIASPFFIDDLPATFVWLKTYDWQPDTYFPGYCRLRQDVIAEYESLLQLHNFDTLYFSLSTWANTLFIQLLDDDDLCASFVHLYTPGSLTKTDTELFLNFLLVSRREAVLGIFDEDFRYHWERQTQPERCWPTDWYAAQLQCGFQLGVASMHTHMVPFFQDYHNGVAGKQTLLTASLAEIKTIEKPQRLSAALIDIMVNRPIPVADKVAQVCAVIDARADRENLWRCTAHHLASVHLSDTAFKPAYETLLCHLFVPHPESGLNNWQHPGFEHALYVLKRFYTNTLRSDQQGAAEYKRLAWCTLRSGTIDTQKLDILGHMQAIDAEPWDVFALFTETSAEGSASVVLPELL